MHRESLPTENKLDKLGLDASTRRKGKPLLKLDDQLSQHKTIDDNLQVSQEAILRRSFEQNSKNGFNQPPTSPMSVVDYKQLGTMKSLHQSELGQLGTLQSDSEYLEQPQQSYAVVPVIYEASSQNQLGNSE